MISQEHFEWCKNRALNSLNEGDNYVDVYNTFVGDMELYDDSTPDHPSLRLGEDFMNNGMITNSEELKRFLNSPF